MRAAVGALRQSKPARIIVAAPVAAAQTVRILREEADSVVCLSAPQDFHAVSMWYQDFSQTSDEEVSNLLESAAQKGVFDVDVPRRSSD
jgi:predicted phosphoribosyltransferase